MIKLTTNTLTTKWCDYSVIIIFFIGDQMA